MDALHCVKRGYYDACSGVGVVGGGGVGRVNRGIVGYV